jgi:hypothetical protein
MSLETLEVIPKQNNLNETKLHNFSKREATRATRPTKALVQTRPNGPSKIHANVDLQGVARLVSQHHNAASMLRRPRSGKQDIWRATHLDPIGEQRLEPGCEISEAPVQVDEAIKSLVLGTASQ